MTENSVNGALENSLEHDPVANGNGGTVNGDVKCNVCCNDLSEIVFVGDYNGRYYPTHKSLLIKSSGFFQEYFQLTTSKSVLENPVFITDVEPAALVQCLDFIYTGRLQITKKNLKNFAEAALVLKMDAVWDCCVAYGVTHVDIDTFFDLRMMAATSNSRELLDATEMFALCNFEKLMGHEEFALLDKPLLLTLLKNKKIKMIPERMIYEAVIAWIMFIPSKRKHHLPELLHLVNLEQIPVDYLRDFIHTEPLVIEDPECRNLLEDALFCHLHSNQSMEDGSTVMKQEAMVIVDKNLKLAKYFNPWSGDWKTFNNSGFYEKEFTAVSVGKSVYFFGEDRSVYALDTTARSWREMEKMTIERGKPSAAALDGYIYVSGGFTVGTGKGMRAAERFNPERNTWERIQSMKKPRLKHCLAPSGDFIYAIGGLNNNNVAVKLVERISPNQGAWMNFVPMKKARSSAFCAVKEGTIYVMGGTYDPDSSIEMLNANGSSWVTITSSIPTNVVSCCAVADDIYVVCHHEDSKEGSLEIKEIYLDGTQPSFVEKIDGLTTCGGLSVVSV